MAPEMSYWPDAGRGPKFYAPLKFRVDLQVYLVPAVRKYPEIVVMQEDGPAGLPLGVLFGPEHDPELDGRIAEMWKVPTRLVSDVKDVPRAEVPRPSAATQDPDQDSCGRGRPAKYPFKSMRGVGDWFLVTTTGDVKAARHKVYCACSQYLKTYKLDGVCKFEFVMTGVGVLVVMTQSEDDRVSGRGEVVYVD
jgi:hypothetical protein